jgi:hypothetical protein
MINHRACWHGTLFFIDIPEFPLRHPSRDAGQTREFRAGVLTRFLSYGIIWIRRKKNENSNAKTRRKEEMTNANHEYITDYLMLKNKKIGRNGLPGAPFMTRPDAYGKIISRTKSGRITWRFDAGGMKFEKQKKRIKKKKYEMQNTSITEII